MADHNDDHPTEGLADDGQAPASLGPPPQIDHYEPIRPIGDGGFGEVWLAQQHEPVSRFVAIKLIKPGMGSRQILGRFESERQALARMDHPYIAKVFDAGTAADGRPYFVMEYVEGISITRYCDKHRLTTIERLNLFVEVCKGVQHAHQKALIHRDLKPSNILINDQDGEPIPKIIDFGIAKATEQRFGIDPFLTHVGKVVGTPAYMSPEQAGDSGEGVDTRSDVYSLGVLLYELLVGALPFENTELRLAGVEEIRRRIMEQDPPRPSTRIRSLGTATTTHAANRSTDPPSLARHLKGDLDWIILKAMEKDRARRYSSPNEFAADIGRHLSDKPVNAGPPDASYRVGKFVRRHRLGVASAALILVALVGGLALALWGFQRANLAEAKAKQEAEAAQRVAGFMIDLFEAPDPTSAQGEAISAKQILDRGVEKIESELDSQPQTKATLLETMGRVYRVMGHYEEARPLLEHAIEIREGDSGAELGNALSELATIRSWQGDYEEAERLAREALVMLEQQLGTEHLDVADGLNALGNALQNQNKLDEAETTHRRALEIRERQLGEDDLSVGQSAHNLAIVLFMREEYEQAEALYKRSAAIERKLNGEDNHNYASSLHTLAILYQTQQRYAEAIEIELRSLQIRERILGAEHPHVAYSLTTLGNLYRAEGRAIEAEPLLQRAVSIGDQVWGPVNAEVRWMRRSLAAAIEQQGRLSEAEQMLRWLIARCEEADNESSLPPTLNALGNLLILDRQANGAEEQYARSLAIDEATEGKQSPYLSDALTGLTLSRCIQGRTVEAQESLQRAASVVGGLEELIDDTTRREQLVRYLDCARGGGEDSVVGALRRLLEDE